MRQSQPSGSILWMALLWAAVALPGAHGAWYVRAKFVNDCVYDIEGTTSMGDTFRLGPGEESKPFVICEAWCTVFTSCFSYPWSFRAYVINKKSIEWDQASFGT